MSGFSQINEIGHETINKVNDFTHQLFGTVCDVITHIVPQTELHDNEDVNVVRRHIQCDIHQDDTHLKIVAYIPGVEKDNLRVVLDNEQLSINAFSNHRDNEFSFLKNRKYSRTFNLPSGTTSENVTLSYSNGILKVTVNKPQPPSHNTTLLNIN